MPLQSLARRLWFLPPPRRNEPIQTAAGVPLAPRRPLTVLCWNIQFAAGRQQAFFYDYGDAVSVSADVVRHTLEGIAACIRAQDPDVVLLQEVDRHSRRTAFIDQHAALQRSLGLPCHTSTPYFRVPYVPHPPHEHLGRVDMHLSVFSRFQLNAATRLALPALRESPLRRLFNLRRALLDVRLATEDGERALLNTHLSAFSHGDGTLTRQVRVLQAHTRQLEEAGPPWLLAGDLNALPPGDDPRRLGEREQAFYQEETTPILPLFDTWPSPVPPADWRERPERWRTYLPFGAAAPDRTLDYAFHSPRWPGARLQVVPEGAAWSDHLPLRITLSPTIAA